MNETKECLIKGTSDNLISLNTLRFLHLIVGHEPYKFIQKAS